MRDEGKRLVAAARATRSVYERNAAGWDRSRSRTLFEREWLQRLCALIPAGGKVLDLGCGAGEPIAGYLIAEGYDVTGVDFAAPMLDIARARFPDERWVQADMRDLDLGERFDGIIGWDSFFHLTQDEQRAVVPRLARHLAPGGALLLTVGHGEGEVTGTVEGETVYHASLSRAEYAELLRANGLAIDGFVVNDPTCAFHSVLLASARADGVA